MQQTNTLQILSQVIAIVLSSLISLSIQAQVKVTGTVTDIKGEALIGANVFIIGTYDGASTDVNGDFQFKTAVQDTARLQVEYIGYADAIVSVKLQSDVSEIKIVLKEEFNQLKAVTISAGAFEASDTKRAVALKPLDIVTTAGASGDVAGALQTLPGTTTVGESGRLFVRGGSADETQTYVDGMLVHEPYTRTGASTAARGRFNPFIFSGTTFTTGGYSAEYGQALSSVLLLDTKGIELEDEWNIGLMSVGGDLAGTKVWDKGSATAAVSYIDLAPYSKLVPQNLEFERLPYVLNASLSVRQKTSDTGMAKIYGTQSNTKYGVYTKVPGENRSELIAGGDDNTYLNATWRDVIAEKWSLRMGAAYSRNEDSRTIDSLQFNENIQGQHFKAVATHFPSDKVTLKIGADYLHRIKGEEFGTSDLSRQQFNDEKLAVYTESDVFLSNDLALRVGLRAEHGRGFGQLQDFTTVAPRAMLAYKVGDNSQVSLAYGTFYQDAQVRTLLYSNGVSQERADHYIANYQYMSDKRIFRVEASQKNYRDLVRFNQDAQGQLIYGNDGDGYARGIDVWFRDKKTIKNGDYWVSYSYLDTQRKYLDYTETAVPEFAAKHNVSLVYKHWVQKIRSMAGATIAYTSPRRYDDPNDSGYRKAQMDAVQQLNVNWAYLYRENVIFYAAVSNVLGQRQQYGYRFADQPDNNGVYAKEAILPAANRFYFIGCFITLSKKGVNQLDKIQ